VQYKKRFLGKNVDLHPPKPISGYTTARSCKILTQNQLVIIGMKMSGEFKRTTKIKKSLSEFWG
jgi:hypothetical protein